MHDKMPQLNPAQMSPIEVQRPSYIIELKHNIDPKLEKYKPQ